MYKQDLFEIKKASYSLIMMRINLIFNGRAMSRKCEQRRPWSGCASAKAEAQADQGLFSSPLASTGTRFSPCNIENPNYIARMRRRIEPSLSLICCGPCSYDVSQTDYGKVHWYIKIYSWTSLYRSSPQRCYCLSMLAYTWDEVIAQR